MTISGEKGIYYGECKKVNKKWTPYGRGAFNCKDKWVLGYTEIGDWLKEAVRSSFTKRQEFQVCRIERARTTFGRLNGAPFSTKMD